MDPAGHRSPPGPEGSVRPTGRHHPSAAMSWRRRYTAAGPSQYCRKSGNGDLLAWTQHLLLQGDLAKAEPKTLRYRLLHVAARLTRGQRRLWLRIQRTWPWARDLAAAFARLTALPVPTG